MNNFLRLIRFPNLVIIALTMVLLQYVVLLPDIITTSIFPKLSHFSFILFVIYTLCIAAAGNIINDLKDINIDKLNKTFEKQIIPNKITEDNAWIYYFALNFIAFVLSIILPQLHEYNYYTLFINFPFIVGLLWIYSAFLKKLPLIGNIAIAFLCAYVPMLLLDIQINHDFTNKLIDKKVRYIFIGYTLFAFLSTLFREIIKDIEDIEGDRKNGCRTLPIVAGIKGSKIVAFIVGLILLFSVLFFSKILRGEVIKIILLNICISIPVIYALYKLIIAKEKKDFTYVSKLAKWIMLGGIVFILIMKIG
jgi:4-hydroxybenzoate polyprenyltransferase